MKTGSTSMAVEYGVVLIAVSVPIAIAGFEFAALVERVFANVLPQVTTVSMVVGG